MVIRNFVAALHTHRPAYEFMPWTRRSAVDDRAHREEIRSRGARRLSRERAIEGAGSAGFDRRGGRHRISLVASRPSSGSRRLPCAARWSEPACLAILIACGFIGNALLTSAASGVFDRYQARLSWLFLAAGVLVWARLRDARSLRLALSFNGGLAALRLNPGMEQAHAPRRISVRGWADLRPGPGERPASSRRLRTRSS